jgi:hypothetical protein
MSTRSPGRSAVLILRTEQEPFSASVTSMLVGTTARAVPALRPSGGFPSEESEKGLAETLKDSQLCCKDQDFNVTIQFSRVG